MAHRIVHFLGIWLSSIVLSCLYGIVHDQVTIRISPEYYTRFHERLIESDDLTMIALTWGVVATWWMGAIGGLLIALCAIRQDFCPRRFVGIAFKALAICMGFAFAVGVAAYAIGYRHELALRFVSGDDQVRRFSSVYATHNASYLLGTVAILWLCFRVARPTHRSSPSGATSLP